MSAYKAGILYEIPKTNLREKVIGKPAIDSKTGAPTIFTKN